MIEVMNKENFNVLVKYAESSKICIPCMEAFNDFKECIVQSNFTLDNTMNDPDHEFPISCYFNQDMKFKVFRDNEKNIDTCRYLWTIRKSTLKNNSTKETPVTNININERPLKEFSIDELYKIRTELNSVIQERSNNVISQINDLLKDLNKLGIDYPNDNWTYH